MATRISVELEELPGDPFDFTREGDGVGEISQDVKVLHDGREIGTATLRLPLINQMEMGHFSKAGAHVLRERGMV